MSDITVARAAATAAETRVEELFHAVLDKLSAQNKRLAELHDEIRASQPVANGSVCLELYKCGVGCRGCPHPRWMLYRWTEGTPAKPGKPIGINLDAKGEEPILKLARGTKNYQKTAQLIREAKSILSERSALLAATNTLRMKAKIG